MDVEAYDLQHGSLLRPEDPPSSPHGHTQGAGALPSPKDGGPEKSLLFKTKLCSRYLATGACPFSLRCTFGASSGFREGGRVSMLLWGLWGYKKGTRNGARGWGEDAGGCAIKDRSDIVGSPGRMSFLNITHFSTLKWLSKSPSSPQATRAHVLTKLPIVPDGDEAM